MNASNNLSLEDKVLSVKAFCFAVLGMHKARRTALEDLLVVRSRRYSPDHLSLAGIYESLAESYFRYAAGDLYTADELAGEAERIRLLNSKSGKYDFRIGRVIHFRCRIQQHLNNPHQALELGEQALDIYNHTRLLSHQRSNVMHTLIHLHNQVGSPERAQALSREVAVVDYTLTSMHTRRRF